MRFRHHQLSFLAVALGSTLIAAQGRAQDEVQVEVRADHESARLERLRHRNWEPVCTVPCSEPIDPQYSYRIAGPRLIPSQPFRLNPDRPQATVDAEVGTRSGRVVGAILGVGGGIVFVNGLGLFLGGLLLSSSDDPDAEDVGSTLTVAGGVTLGIGAAAGITGLVLMLDNWETDVSIARLPSHPGVAVRLPEPQLDLGRGFALTPRGIVF